MKQVDTNEYISMLRGLVEQGHEVRAPIAGNSMLPFLIHDRDSVALSRPEKPLKVGDIVLYQRESGAYILHRICCIRPEGVYTVGDAQQRIEGPLQRSQIFAVATAACRKGKTVGPGSFWWTFFRSVWIRIIPCRHFLMRLWGIRFPSGKGADHE